MSLSIQARVKQNIQEIDSGIVFSFSDLPVIQEVSSPGAVAVALNRLVKQGEIKRFSTGKYYRPKLGLLGSLPLSDSEKLKVYLYKDGKRNGYITGTLLFNRLGLTTQLPKVYTIAANQALNSKDLNSFRLKVIKSKAPVTDENINYLEILDVFDKIKKIPDGNYSDVFLLMEKKIQLFPANELNKLVELAINYYPPVVRALLGLCLSYQYLPRYKVSIETLKGSLNPLTTYRDVYKYLNSELQQYAKEWNIR